MNPPNTENLSNIDIVVYALYVLGGWRERIHTEDIALKCFEIAPSRFSWVKYPRLFLIESVTSNGPIDGRRYEELLSLFANSKTELVFVTAFPDRMLMRRYLNVLAWETEVWIADSPDHLIHFNGDKFLGPHE